MLIKEFVGNIFLIFHFSNMANVDNNNISVIIQVI